MPRAEPGQAVGQRGVESGDDLQCLRDARRGLPGQLGEVYRLHQRTAPSAGNQCISVRGSGLAGTSR